MKSLFSALNAPYYICTPPYNENSGGVRAMHYLCHALNLAGEEAYVVTDVVSPKLRTPILTDDIKKAHRQTNREPIAVYPEVVADNPLDAVNVVRYMLNAPGHINSDPLRWQPTDLIYTHGPDIVPKGTVAKTLRIPLINSGIYNSRGTNPKQRKGRLLFINRYLSFGGELSPITEGATEISFRVPYRTPEQLSELYRQAELLYTYEQSTACYEAMLCGCPVVYLPNDITLKRPPAGPVGYLGQEGWSWGADPAGIEAAKASVHRTAVTYESSQVAFWQELAAFVDDTQRLAQQNAGKRSAPVVPIPGYSTDNEIYDYWMSLRSFIATDIQYIEMATPSGQPAAISFHILVRLPSEAAALLADTLDSLNQQFCANWHMDILSDMPAPAGLDDIPCIEWHCLNSIQDIKNVKDALVEARKAAWVIEIPAGVQLDALYLWRLVKEIEAAPDACAFFVDDDCHDASGNRHAPRFKPGVNPARLQSSDLAGPICARREAWLDAGGASSRAGSPWFPKLLQLASRFGWGAIRHIPDVLLSYPESFPSDVESCLIGLLENHQAQGVQSEIVPVTGQSWSIRYPLSTTPTITIAIISKGHLDFLPRCFDSIVAKTNYPNYEIVITLTDQADDPDLDRWLECLQSKKAPKVRIVRAKSASNYAACCNLAVEAATSDWVLLIREEAVIIQERWLEELVRTALQPDVAAVSPCMVTPGTSLIHDAGLVLGLKGAASSPYRDTVKLGEAGYLDMLRVARDVSALSGGCLLARKDAFLAAGGMDQSTLGNYYADADLCQKLRQLKQRLIYQPEAVVVYSGPMPLNIESDSEAQEDLSETHSGRIFQQRWSSWQSADPFWNPNLSLDTVTPTPEIDYLPPWRYMPAPVPRIFTHYLGNGQGYYRVTAPLLALRKAGMAEKCKCLQRDRGLSAAEIHRLAPDAVIVQHYIRSQLLSTLALWRELRPRPFIVYALDDLLTKMPETNHFRAGIPANTHARLKYALQHCDRMVVSTDYLAEEYRHLIADIRVVPNRLEQEIWLPLHSQKRKGKKPRIGWAGGTTHQGDLMMLKTIIEQTRHEADWILFGMCPRELRPLVAEYHPLAPLSEYPARLAALNFDIAVAPLAQEPFNRGKSNLRLLEYGILSIPVVCTDIDPYRSSPACCVPNTVDAWVNALRERIYDPDAREREGLAMREWVCKHYLIENHLEEWLQAHLPG